MKKVLLGIVLTLILTSCATQKVDKDAQITSGWSVEQLYTEANEELNSGNYARAIKLYDLLKSRYPYGKFAQQALLDKAYAYYKDEDKDNALAAIDEFQKLYPRHPRSDYILYLKGLVEFDQKNKSFLDRLSDQNWAERDPVSNQKAYKTFAELVERYPDSQYVADATKRMVELVDALGGHEIAVARYYYKMGAFVAAANRAKNVLIDFKNTPYVEEGLAIMLSSYNALGYTELADDSRRLLELNYPNSIYLAKNGWFDIDKKTIWQATKATANKAGKLFNRQQVEEIQIEEVQLEE